MLRCRPSEITLTAADVEESRNRMARRQTAAPSRLSVRPTRPPVGPRVAGPRTSLPRLRRGPERSRDAAIASPGLGTIPSLQPQQAIHSSVDSGSDDEPAIQPAPRNTSPGVPDPPPPEQSTVSGPTLPSTPERSTLTSTGDTPTSPCRIQPLSHRTSTSDAEAESHSSPKRYQFGFSGFGRARTNTSESVHDEPGGSHLPGSTDGAIESQTASNSNNQEIPAVDGAQTTRQHRSHVPSPLHQTHAPSSSFDPDAAGSEKPPVQSNTEEAPPLMLQGYFTGDQSCQYWFKQVVPCTEPRPTANRTRTRPRSASSHSEPPTLRPTQRQRGRYLLAHEDVFDSNQRSDDPESPTTPRAASTVQRQQSSAERFRNRLHDVSDALHSGYANVFRRLRPSHEDESETLSASASRREAQRSSEASSASNQAYSVYELPSSRISSSGAVNQLSQAQVDGSVPSSHAATGLYRSIRPNQIRVGSQLVLNPPPRASSISAPNLPLAPGGHSLAPAPYRPSMRRIASQGSSESSPNLMMPSDLLGSDQDAARAIERNLSSPLEILERRAAAQLSQLSQDLHSYSQPIEDRHMQNLPAFQPRVPDYDSLGPRLAYPVPINPRSGPAGIDLASGDGRYPGFASPTNIPTARATSPHPLQFRNMARPGSSQRHHDYLPRDASHPGGGIMPPRVPGLRDAPPWQLYPQNQNNSRAASRAASNRTTMRPRMPPDHPYQANPRDHTHHYRDPFQQGRGAPPHPGRPHGPTTLPTVATSPPLPSQRLTFGYGASRPTSPTSLEDMIFGSLTGPPNPRLISPRQTPSMIFNNRVTSPSEFNSARGGPPQSGHRIQPNIREGQVVVPGRQSSRTHQQADRQPTTRPTSSQANPREYQPRNLLSNAGNTRAVPPRVAPGAAAPPPRRRMLSSQQNQENSLAAEIGLMREELSAVGMRYGEGGEQAIMDDTPPSLGRFERRMGGDPSLPRFD